MSEKKLTMWFTRRRESNVVKGTREHILKIVDACEDLDNAVGHMVNKEPEKAKQAVDRLYMNEKAADNIEMSLREGLAIGDLDPKEREDLMHLVRRIDHIADWSKSAAKNIEVLIEADIEIPVKIWELYKRITGRLLDIANCVRSCINHLGKNDQEFKKQQKKVHTIEHEIDHLYFEARKQIIMTVGLDPRIIFVLRDMIHAMENAADSCESAANLLNIIYIANR